MKKLILIAMAVISLVSQSPAEQPVTAQVYFISPTDGATVDRKFDVKFGLRGMGVAPAGVQQENTGHHHLLIDVAELPDLSGPLPMTDNIHHFGKGQTETTVELPPGKHTLQLILGNAVHIPIKDMLSDKITVTVK